jgi:hypothetical protein
MPVTFKPVTLGPVGDIGNSGSSRSILESPSSHPPEHRRMLGWIHVQPHDVDGLLFKCGSSEAM